MRNENGPPKLIVLNRYCPRCAVATQHVPHAVMDNLLVCTVCKLARRAETVKA